MKLSRRDTLILAASATIASSFGLRTANAQEGTKHDEAKLANVAIPDHVLGSADAKVTVIEYASPTCPHCARFSNEVFAAFKKEFVDTGKVKFILRPYIRNVQDAMIFLLAYAAAEGTPEPVPGQAYDPASVNPFYKVIESFFATQSAWAFVEPKEVRKAALTQASQLGFTKETFEAALTNQDLFAKLQAMQVQAAEEFKLEGTPTFYINGQQFTGEKTIDDFKAVVDPLVG